MGSSGFGYKIAEQFGLKMRAAARSAGATDVRRRAAFEIRRSVGRLSRGDRGLRQDALRGGDAVHPSRPERTGDPADLVLLARRQDIVVEMVPPIDVFDSAEKIRRNQRRQDGGHAREASTQTGGAHEVEGAPSMARNIADLSDASLANDAASMRGACGRPEAKATAPPKSRRAASIPPASDFKSLRRKAVPGLYFIGEVVDVTGWLGGYNFQWAWSSGYAAGRHL